jgi:hypothetical protein
MNLLRFFCRTKIYTNYLLLCTQYRYSTVVLFHSHLTEFLAKLLNIFTLFPALFEKAYARRCVRVFTLVDFRQHYY